MTKTFKKTFRERNQSRVGVFGMLAVALVLALSLSVGTLRSILSGTEYTALLVDTGGLRSGDAVRVAGLQVGRVTSIELEGSTVTVRFVAGGVELGADTSAVVTSEDALGKKALDLTPKGGGRLSTIPLARTDAGIAVTESLGRLATTTGRINGDKLARSFDSLSTVLNQTPKEFRQALTGVSALSRSISRRDAALGDLLQRSSSLSSVLAERSAEITSLMSDGSAFFDELIQRRDLIRALLRNVVVTTAQLQGLVNDHRNSLRPALTELRQVAKLLTRYRGTLNFALKKLGSFTRALGESVSSGPFFQAYVSNLTEPQNLAPALDGILPGLGGTR
jgi:phospholipid/cholesterol/gamma-HCH transport system substrate-binding protein